MSKPNLNEVKAGEYEIVAPYWDEILSKPGQPFNFKRHRRGETVTLDVEQARRLVNAGAVVKPGEANKAVPPGAGPSVAPGSKPEPAAGTVEAILAEVGDDPEKAQTALDAEVNERGDKARKTLVEPLEAIITNPGSGS